jgi:hypothetical protein
MNMGKIILDLCGGCEAWSRPYKEAGYDVRVITLPYYDICQVNLNKEYVSFPWAKFGLGKEDYFGHLPLSHIYGILAAPPCTEFSVAKNGAHRNRDYELGMKTVRACMEIIWHCQTYGKLAFWALENPGFNGHLRYFLGKPPWEFKQWQFGGDQIKRTAIWGFYNEPEPIYTQMPLLLYNADTKHAKRWSKPECPPEYQEYINQFKGDARRAAIRAITPSGFAHAFFEANR